MQCLVAKCCKIRKVFTIANFVRICTIHEKKPTTFERNVKIHIEHAENDKIVMAFYIIRLVAKLRPNQTNFFVVFFRRSGKRQARLCQETKKA